MRDLRAHDVDMLTVGQYLQPSKHHLPVTRFVHPDEFRMFEGRGGEDGLRERRLRPMVRSSYHADLQAKDV
jgi:lipoic acid synthetase